MTPSKSSAEMKYRVNTFAEMIAAFFNARRCFLFAKGRVGLYAGLRAMGLPRGAKILMPGYTCMVVPSAVQYAGLTPGYVDIDPKTYNIDPSLLDSAASPDVAALIVQHTYGIPCDMAAIQAWTDPRRISIIEDCCHTLGTRIDGRLCGTFGAMAFMSGQWNKPFSTGLGGMLLVNDDALAEAVAHIVEHELRQPPGKTNLILRCQIAAYDLLVRPSTAMLLMLIYRAFVRLGLMRGSSSTQELRGEMPDDYFTAMAPCQIRRGLREIARVDENIRHRTEMTAFYDGELSKIGLKPLDVPGIERQPLLRYPVRVANKGEIVRLAVRKGVEIGSWFECPLHPEGTRQQDFGYEDGMCPESERAAREVVNLPTHLKVTRRIAEKALEFLRRYAQPIS
ncbi:MAG: DegT/DnrJ/EryC1/StrS family aminotransferase [Thermoguttaceae bacterium]